MPVKQLNDGTYWTKATYWEEGMSLKGGWLILRKVDGVRVLRNKYGQVWSRDSKPLYNVDHLEFKDAEFFHKDWNTSVSIVRTMTPTIPATQDMIYELSDGNYDSRLFIGIYTDPSPELLKGLMEERLSYGDEGLILRKGNKWLKVVPEIFADVRITNFTEGKGKYAGMLGSLTTAHGSVGSFKTQIDKNGYEVGDAAFRKHLWKNRDKLKGKIIQVSYREVTANGKLRFPKLVKIRLDKETEDLPWTRK